MLKKLQPWAHLIGPILFLIILFMPSPGLIDGQNALNNQQQKFLATFTLVVCNWLFTSIPLYITGLLGVSISVLTGVSSANDAFAPFASPIIFLFLGGFLFARSMHKVELDKRISLYLLSRNFIAGSFNRMLIALIALTAFFSMWVSNTATTAMMLPIVLGTLNSLEIEDKETTSLVLLAIAYAASIGGLGTPIGSPPNIIAIGFLSELANINISFLHWSIIGIPFVVLFLAFLYKYITLRLPNNIKSFDNSFLKEELSKLPRIQTNEIIIAVLFSMTVFFWFMPSFMGLLLEKSSAAAIFIKERFNSGIIAVFFSGLLFIFPLNSTRKILIADDIKRIDWGSLLLFGSGLSLGKILFATGLAEITGNALIGFIASGQLLLLLLVLVYFTIFSTELASNTASANILLPIIIAMSLKLEINPLLPTLAVAMACSLAFMLPVATPPNAIVYGSEKVEMSTMIKLGLILNIVFGLLLSLSFYITSFMY
jgi:sodium-dependent dicarboxylate transporter 2/3/5